MLDFNSFEAENMGLSDNSNPISGFGNNNTNINDEEDQKRILARQAEEEKRKERI